MSAQVHHKDTEELQGQLLLVSQERDQLLDALQGLRQQKQQLQEELEERMEAVCQQHQALTSVVPTCLRTYPDTMAVLFLRLHKHIVDLACWRSSKSRTRR